MEFISAKLKSMKQKEDWDYGNDFKVIRSGTKWYIFKSGMIVLDSSKVSEIAREVKLTFIATEITNRIIAE